MSDGVEIDGDGGGDEGASSVLQPLMMPSPAHHMLLGGAGAQSPMPPSSTHSPHIGLASMPMLAQSPHYMQYAQSPAHVMQSPAHMQQHQQQQQQQPHFSQPSPHSNGNGNGGGGGGGGGGVRRRAVQKGRDDDDGEGQSDQVRRLVRTLKTLDVYPKTQEEEVMVKTGSGGLIR